MTDEIREKIKQMIRDINQIGDDVNEEEGHSYSAEEFWSAACELNEALLDYQKGC